MISFYFKKLNYSSKLLQMRIKLEGDDWLKEMRGFCSVNLHKGS